LEVTYCLDFSKLAIFFIERFDGVNIPQYGRLLALRERRTYGLLSTALLMPWFSKRACANAIVLALNDQNSARSEQPSAK
jgi:hypothetical protein